MTLQDYDPDEDDTGFDTKLAKVQRMLQAEKNNNDMACELAAVESKRPGKK